MTATPLAPMAEEEKRKKRRRQKSPPTPPVNSFARKEALRLRQSAAVTIRAAIDQMEAASPTSLRASSGDLEVKRLRLALQLLAPRSVPQPAELESPSAAGTRHRKETQRRLDAILKQIREELGEEVDPSG